MFETNYGNSSNYKQVKAKNLLMKIELFRPRTAAIWFHMAGILFLLSRVQHLSPPSRLTMQKISKHLLRSENQLFEILGLQLFMKIALLSINLTEL